MNERPRFRLALNEGQINELAEQGYAVVPGSAVTITEYRPRHGDGPLEPFHDHYQILMEKIR